MHEIERHLVTQKEINACNALQIKGKYFVPPPPPSNDARDFKELFAYLASVGAGRLVEKKSGVPNGPWTPELLARAICEVNNDATSIDIRTVQHWFQSDDKGISPSNIHLLARIFGCDDPDATISWQAALSSSNRRLGIKRRQSRLDPAAPAASYSDTTNNSPTLENTIGPTRNRSLPRTLAEKAEWYLSGSGAMSLAIIFWLVFFAHGFINYVFGTLTVTYTPHEGLDKEVGLIWAPPLIISPLILIPLYIFSVSNIITSWKTTGRNNCLDNGRSGINIHHCPAWIVGVNDFTFSFWSVAAACFLIVFGLQVFGIYMPAFISGNANGVHIDRFLVVLFRPDVLSIPEAIIVTVTGYLYTTAYVIVFIYGLIFLLIIVRDYRDIFSTSKLEGIEVDSSKFRHEGMVILSGCFRVVIIGMWLAISLKLQASYLCADSSNIIDWLLNDAVSFFGVGVKDGNLNDSSVTHFSTFVMVVVAVAAFVICAHGVRNLAFAEPMRDEELSCFSQDRVMIQKMFAIVFLVSQNVLTIGMFKGFSLLLLASIVGSIITTVGLSPKTAKG